MDVPYPTAAERAAESFKSVDREAIIDLRRLGSVLRRRWRVIALTSLLVVATVASIFLMTDRRYTAQAKVALERGGEQVVKVDQVVPQVDPDSASVDTEVEVLRSAELAGEVVDRLGLAKLPEFNGREAPVPAPDATDRRRAISTVLRNLTVKREGFSYAIAITYESGSPQIAAAVANGLSDTYVARQVRTKASATDRARVFLEAKIDQLRAQVLSAEAAVQAYRARNGILAANSNSTVTQEELSGLNAQVAEAKAQEAAAQARLNTARAQLSAGGSGEELGEALDSPVVSQLRAQRAQIGREVASLRARYGPRHPELRRAEQALQDTDEQINAEVKRILANVTIQANVAEQRTASLAGSLARTEGELAANNAASVRLNELERDAESARAIYQTFLDRYKQTLAQRGLERSESYIVARATVPGRPTTPNPFVFAAIGIVGALALSAALVAILQLLEPGLSTSTEVERKLGLPALSPVPDIRTLPELRRRGEQALPIDLVVSHPQSSFAEAFRRLRTSLLSPRLATKPKVIAIASALPNEGKTTTAISLARTAAAAGLDVILVDCDLRRRATSRALGVNGAVGLGDVLTGAADLDSAIVSDPLTGMSILAQAGETGLKSLGDVPAFHDLIAALRTRYDWVVLDTPPVLPVDDARVIAGDADAVVFLARWRATPAKAVELALQQLDDVGANVIGVSLTVLDVVEQARSGFGDAFYYHKKYQAYYA